MASFFFFKSRIWETPTLSTDADSRFNTNLKRLCNFDFWILFFFMGCVIYFFLDPFFWEEGGVQPIRGQIQGLKKIAWEGDIKHTDRQTDTRTSRLLDQLSPEGRVGENNVSIWKMYCICSASPESLFSIQQFNHSTIQPFNHSTIPTFHQSTMFF